MADKVFTREEIQQELAQAQARVDELRVALSRLDGDSGGMEFDVPDSIVATRELLELFARGATRRDYLDHVRDLLQRWSGCESIGLRLIDRRKYIPYESWSGFEQLFYEKETDLSLAHDQCACIRVATGQPEPQDLPHMTAGGSYLIGDSRAFVASLNEQEASRFRLTCMNEGFLSLAIIPIRYRKQIIGAIHMAHHEAHIFSPQLVAFIETMSPLIGEAVHRFNVEDYLRQSNELLERTFESIDLHIAYMDDDLNFVCVNRGFAQAGGHAPDWFVGRNHFELYPHAKNERIFRRVVQTGVPYFAFDTPFEYGQNPQQGTTYWDWSLQPVKDRDGQVGGVVLCMINVTDRKTAEQSIAHLEKQLLEISSREQRRIGQDLHDVLGQQLTGLAFLARILQEKLIAQHLPEAEDATRISELIKQSISQTRALARGLCPIEAKAEGFMSALSAFAANIEQYYGIGCSFECPEPVLVQDVNAATHLYHIVQEATNNAIKHGKAKKVTIRLGRDVQTLYLHIADDGIGIDPMRENGKGLGLSIMQYRAGLLGGCVEVKPHAEGGTIVVCQCRLPQ